MQERKQELAANLRRYCSRAWGLWRQQRQQHHYHHQQLQQHIGRCSSRMGGDIGWAVTAGALAEGGWAVGGPPAASPKECCQLGALDQLAHG